AQGRMQRSVGHADGGKHHGPGGRRLGRVRAGRRVRGKSARDGPRRGRTHHALQEALRKKGTQWSAANRVPSRPGRSPRLRGEWVRLSSSGDWFGVSIPKG